MPKKRSPVFQRVSNLLKISISLTKMRKPIIPKLPFLRKSSGFKKLKLLKHYNYYGHIQEYHFSPSNAPVAHYHPRHKIKRKSIIRGMQSMFFMCWCLGRLRAERGDGDYSLKALPTTGDEVPIELSYSSCEDDSIDERAERFIERFYEEMRMQRQESVAMQLSGILDV